MARMTCGLVLALVLFAPARVTTACSCATISLATQVAYSDYVFTGRVLRVDTLEQFLAATIATDEVFKGGVPPQFEVWTDRSSASCGYTQFAVGEDFLLFALAPNEYSANPYTHLCTRNSLLSSAGQDLSLLRSVENASEYLPIEEGNTWSYVYPPYETTFPITVRIDNVEEDGGRTWFSVEGLLIPADTLFADTLGNIWWQAGDSEEIAIDFSVADSGSYEISLGDIPFLVTVERDATVYSHLGQFENCIRFELTSEGSDAEWSFSFAPGVGLVLLTGSNGAWYGLSAATISGKEIVHTAAEHPDLPSTPGLTGGIHPNPFENTATITLDLPSAASVRVTVHDALGREVEALANTVLGPGAASLTLDTSGLASGLYFVRVSAGERDLVLSAVRL